MYTGSILISSHHGDLHSFIIGNEVTASDLTLFYILAKSAKL
jgi:hypothetical protein